MFLCGHALGFAFDGYRVLYHHLHLHRRYIPLFDLLYCFLSMVFVFWVLYSSASGEVRVIFFLFIAASGVLYFQLWSKFTIQFFTLLIKIITFVCYWFAFIITRPFIWMYKIFTVFFALVTAMTIFLYKIVLQLLYPLWSLIRYIFLICYRWLSRTYISHWINKLVTRLKKLWTWVKRLF